MFKKNVFIHIGGHKTGSSAIHYCLKKNFKNLLKQNFFYFDTYKNEDMHNFLNLNKEKENVKYINSIIREIKNINQDNIIISRGSLCGSIAKKYDNSEIFAQYLSKLKKYFNVKIIYYIRDPLPFLISVYFQLKKNQKYINLDIQEFVSNSKPHKFFEKTILSYKKYFENNLIILNYSKVFKNDHKFFLDDFFKTIDRSIKIIPSNLNINYSLNENSKFIIENSFKHLSEEHKVKALKILKILNKFDEKIFKRKIIDRITYHKNKLNFLKDFQSKSIWLNLNSNYDLDLNLNYKVEAPKKNLIFNLFFFLCSFCIFGFGRKINLLKFYKSLFILK